MRSDKYGQTILDEKDIVEGIYSGKILNLSKILTDSSELVQQTNQAITENYDKFHLDNIVQWWKNKASNRYENLQSEDKIRSELEVWTENKQIDIIR